LVKIAGERLRTASAAPQDDEFKKISRLGPTCSPSRVYNLASGNVLNWIAFRFDLKLKHAVSGGTRRVAARQFLGTGRSSFDNRKPLADLSRKIRSLAPPISLPSPGAYLSPFQLHKLSKRLL
jgi:hypothetical protein